MPRIRPVLLPLAILSVVVLSTFSLAAAPDRISGAISVGQTVALHGAVPLQARRGTDEGPVDPSTKMHYLTLLTKPSAAQQKALNKLLADQQNPRSASYHKWLTPEQYADRFGLSQSDVKKITDWLQSQGFAIVKTARGRNWIVFSGTAGQVEKTFQTEIHNFNVKGETHFANTTPPLIPSALSGVVAAFRGFNNFRAKSQFQRGKPQYTLPVGGGGDLFYIAPGDIATMYDLKTLYNLGFDGTGQRLAVIGQTDVYLDDLADFRSGFGLSAISCTVSGTNVITACNTSNFQYVLIARDTDPGAPDSIGDDLPEADIDIQWSGATARNAQIIFVNAPDPDGNGIYDSMYDAIDNDRAPVMTMSYTFPCELAEADEGTYTVDEAEFQKANSEGITFMNSAGDTGAAECDYGNDEAVYGYAVAYPASSAEITGVGGTLIPYNEYTDIYWGTANGSDGGSALQYIPEQVWNDSQEWSIFCTNNPTNSTCEGNPGLNSWQTAQESYIGLVAGGGGVSNCVVDSGSPNFICESGIPQPSWQAGLSSAAVNPGGIGEINSGVATRYSPDVSLLASIYWPGYIVCTAVDELVGGTTTTSSCSPGGSQGILNNLQDYGFSFGGTSISSPIFAGIVSMLNQYLNGSTNAGLGNINPTLYTVAATPANGAFHAITGGSNGAWCQGGQPSGQPVALQCPSTGPSADFIGFSAGNFDPTTHYNLAVGLGSVDGANLFAAWAAAGLSSTTTSVDSSENPSNFGDSVTFTATVVTSGTQTPTGTVTFKDGNTTLGTGTLGCVCNGIVNSATASYTTSALASGSHSITAVYGGDSNNAGSTSSVLTQVVNPPTFTLSSPTTPATVLSGQSSTSTFTVTATGTGVTTFAGNVTFACNGLPDSTVTCTFLDQHGNSQIEAGTSSPDTVTLTITTTGPNPNAGVKKQLRRRADNRIPWLPMTLPLAGVVMLGIAGRKRSRYSMAGALFVSLAMIGLLIACGGGSGTPAVGISVSPEASTLYPNDSADSWPPQTASFTATVTNSTNTGVNWALSTSASGVSCTDSSNPCGTIAAGSGDTVNYTAPTIATGLPGTVTLTATAQADTSKTATAGITLTKTTVPGSYPLTVTGTEGGTNVVSNGFTLTVQ